ncbi:MAG TPA: hypothetical protein VH476_10815 [Solirubrobacterales bacterium]
MSAHQEPPPQLLDLIGNLAEFHREHEKFYSQAPLQAAVDLEAESRILKALAGHWRDFRPEEEPLHDPLAGAEDLNVPGLPAESGVLFMEGGAEPAEIFRLRRDLERLASAVEETAAWLARAMEQAWQVAAPLVEFPALAGVLGERHQIIVNDWLAADMQAMIGRLLRRAIELLARIDFTPAALRADLAGNQDSIPYLLSASELIDRAADLLAASATLVHENERRWRVFAERVEAVRREADPAEPPR